MPLCNPDILIEWRKVSPPKFKKDYEGRLLRVPSFGRKSYDGFGPAVPLPPDGAVCRIARRYNECSGGEYKLELAWPCPSCGKTHASYIPESWIAEGNAAFVEAVGLADFTHNLRDEATAMLFLTSSYHHPEAAKMGARADLVAQCAAWLQQSGFCVISPIPMIHAIDRAVPGAEGSIISHLEASLRMLEMCEALCVLLLDEVRDSSVVAAELGHARSLGIPCNQISLGEEDGSFSIIPAPRWWR